MVHLSVFLNLVTVFACYPLIMMDSLLAESRGLG